MKLEDRIPHNTPDDDSLEKDELEGTTRRGLIKTLVLVGGATLVLPPGELLASPRKYSHLPEDFDKGVWFDQESDSKNQISPELISELLQYINQAFERIDKAQRVKHKSFRRSGMHLPDYFPESTRGEDVNRLLALIIKESEGKSDMVSSSDARGLCQIRGVATADVIENFPALSNVSYDLHDPVDNIVLGLVYLKILEKHHIDPKFGEDNPDKDQLLFASYNGGVTRIRKIADKIGTTQWPVIANKLSSIIVERQKEDGYGEDRKWHRPVETLDPTYGINFLQYDTGIKDNSHDDDVIFSASGTGVKMRKAQEFIRYAEIIPAIQSKLKFGSSPKQNEIEGVETKNDKALASPMHGESIWDLHKRFRIETDFDTWLAEFKRVNNMDSNMISLLVTYKIPEVSSLVVSTTLYSAMKQAGLDPKQYPLVWEYNMRCNTTLTSKTDINHLSGQRIYLPPQLSKSDSPRSYKIGEEGDFKSIWSLLSQIKPLSVHITPSMLSELVEYNKKQGNGDFDKAKVNGMSVLGLKASFSVLIPKYLFGEEEGDIPFSPETIPYTYDVFPLSSHLPNPFRVSMWMFENKDNNVLRNIPFFHDETETEYIRRKYLRLILYRFNQQYYPQVFDGKKYDEKSLKQMLIPTDVSYYEKLLNGSDDTLDNETIEKISSEGAQPGDFESTDIDLDALHFGRHYIDKSLDAEGNKQITNPDRFDVSTCKKGRGYGTYDCPYGHREKTSHIIIHSTASNNENGILDTGKAHFVVKQNGEIIQIRDRMDEINHAGFNRRSSTGATWNGDTRITYHSVAIEVCQENRHEWNRAQYKAVKKLIHALGAEYGIKKRNVLGHYQIGCTAFGRGSKGDPYVEVDWEKLDLPDNSKRIDVEVLEGRILPNLAEIKKSWKFKNKALTGLRACAAKRKK